MREYRTVSRSANDRGGRALYVIVFATSYASVDSLLEISNEMPGLARRIWIGPHRDVAAGDLMDEPRFVDDAARRRYQLLIGDDEVAFIEYDLVGDKSILIKHTEVPTAHEGKGFASKLLQQALERLRVHNKTVIPVCPYALNWLRRHPAYHDLVREELRRTL
jgi:predicted GNAT family acetyltransferase